LVNAGSHRAEAGYQDPALGWVGVRADSSGGQVHATLVPGSADAAQALGGHLAGLHDYLAEVHTPVESLTLANPESREVATGAGQDQNQGMNQGAGQGGSSESASQPPPAMQSGATASPSNALDAAAGPGNQAPEAYGRSGNHISVMA
jgi:hypothetical protein